MCPTFAIGVSQCNSWLLDGWRVAAVLGRYKGYSGTNFSLHWSINSRSDYRANGRQWCVIAVVHSSDWLMVFAAVALVPSPGVSWPCANLLRESEDLIYLGRYWSGGTTKSMQAERSLHLFVQSPPREVCQKNVKYNEITVMLSRDNTYINKYINVRFIVLFHFINVHTTLTYSLVCLSFRPIREHASL